MAAMRFVLASLLAGALPAQERVDFDRDIRPLLAERCLKCHGPDGQARKADLRLDLRDSVLAAREDPARTIVAPGDPDRSELWRRVASDDPDFHMPPPRSKLPRLDDAQRALVRRWIEEGAVWGEHWALRPLAPRVPVPRTGDANAQPIDAFVDARLRAHGLTAAPPAPPAQLLRRVTFDLTGLPPSLAELDAFLADAAPDAYERAVDRLLASPRFGERVASDWLDAARYADTHGYQADRYRPTWPWRDWVVRAFNENLPYDAFLTWQLAGDLLPDATREQRLATAFNRLHRQTEEGGSIEEEFRVEYVADRVETFASAMLGLTIGCARCHDHKHDPIAQAEYYGLFAFFQNIDESGQTSHFTDAIPVPALLLPDAAKEAELEALAVHVRDAERALAECARDARTRCAEWLATKPGAAPLAGLVAAFPLDAIGKDNALANSVEPARTGRAVDAPQSVAGHSGGALAMNGENAATFPGVGNFTRSDPFSIGLWLRIGETKERAVVVHKTRAALDAASRGYEVLLEAGRPTFTLAHMWPGNAIKIAASAALPLGRWTHVLATYDGSSRAAGMALYVDGARADAEVIRDRLTKDIVYERGGAPDLIVGQRFRDRGLAGGAVDELLVFDRCLSSLEAAELAQPGALSAALARAEPDGALIEYWQVNVDPRWRGRRQALHAVRDAHRRAIEGVPEIMVMDELAQPKPAFVLGRGEYDQRRARVEAGTPGCLPPLGTLPRNRLGLARWLTASDHPLTARVAVNRFWQMLFGRGLVESAGDFGTQGARPTHPELLDWLARAFVDSGWDVKALLRTIVTSQTYRRASTCSDELRAADPDNLLLGRAPSHRWPAEMIRDGALAASGLLVEKLGGPPVKPYEPDGLWLEKSGQRYERDRGDGQYRRSLYTFWKRTSPPPTMILFDMPSREECSVQRQQTATPQQALALWNDPQFVECARVLAARALAHAASHEERARFVFRSLTSRPPDARELAVLLELEAEQREAFAADPARARELLAVGDAPAPENADPVELAALTMLASVLLGYDETLTRR
jgi:hypothetical protein